MNTVVMNMPNISASQVQAMLPSLNPYRIIEDAYIKYYDVNTPPQKIRVTDTNGEYVLSMPYYDVRDNVYFEKLIYGKRVSRPGIRALAWMVDFNKGGTMISLDATDITGYRTAAKSLYVTNMIMGAALKRLKPLSIDIYGSSTQAQYHAWLFKMFYQNANITVVVRTPEAGERLTQMMQGALGGISIVLYDDRNESDADVIVTATSSPTPIINESLAQSAKLIIAVGSSRGEQTEVVDKIIKGSHLLIDSRISITGKGEANIACENGWISRDSIDELAEIIRSGGQTLFKPAEQVLFISKGLVVEDYACVRALMQALSN